MPAIAAVFGRRDDAVRPALEGLARRDRRGFFGRRRRAKAPISVGRTVTAPTATEATTIAEPTPIRPTNGMPVASRPAIATTTIAPAATTLVPAVPLATRALWATESPAASCSR